MGLVVLKMQRVLLLVSLLAVAARAGQLCCAAGTFHNDGWMSNSCEACPTGRTSSYHCTTDGLGDDTVSCVVDPGNQCFTNGAGCMFEEWDLLDIVSSACDTGWVEVADFNIQPGEAGTWFGEKCCCPETGPCAGRGEAEGCSYETAMSTLSCPTGTYEDLACTKDFLGVFEHEFCCADTNKCTEEHGDRCRYELGWGQGCDAGWTEIKECTVTSWLGTSNNEFCCPVPEGLCDPAHNPDRKCSYNTDLLSSGCPDGTYEEKDCSVSYYGGLHTEEFCCEHTKCMQDNGDGCKYQKEWGTTCDAGWVEIPECSVESWLGTSKDEFCCPVPEGLCDASENSEKNCFYQTEMLASSCPSGYYEETACSQSYYGGLHVEEFCCEMKCIAENEGCGYQSDWWGAKCPKGFAELEECSVTSWSGIFSDEFCCPLPEGACHPDTDPERGCFFETQHLMWECPAGYEEEKGCSRSFYGGLHIEEFCCKNECTIAESARNCFFHNGDACPAMYYEDPQCSSESSGLFCCPDQCTAEESALRPVVVIPSFMGSRLKTRGEVECLDSVHNFESHREKLAAIYEPNEAVWMNIDMFIRDVLNFGNERCFTQCMTLDPVMQRGTCDLYAAEAGIDEIDNICGGFEFELNIDIGPFKGGITLDPTELCKITPDGFIFHQFFERLRSIGYTEGENMAAAPYDFRLSPDALDERGYFATLQKTLERLVNSSNVGGGAVVVAHSLGNNVFRAFTYWLERELGGEAEARAWMQRYIENVVLSAAPLLGAPDYLKSAVTGTHELDLANMIRPMSEALSEVLDYLDFGFKADEGKRVMSSWGSGAMMFPIWVPESASTEAYDTVNCGKTNYERAVLGYAPVSEADDSRAYLYVEDIAPPDAPSVFARMGAMRAGDEHLQTLETILAHHYRNDSLWSRMREPWWEPPSVGGGVYCMYGTGLRTVLGYDYSMARTGQWTEDRTFHERGSVTSQSPDSSSASDSKEYEREESACEHRESGDGTVTYRSLSWCHHWIGETADIVRRPNKFPAARNDGSNDATARGANVGEWKERWAGKRDEAQPVTTWYYARNAEAETDVFVLEFEGVENHRSLVREPSFFRALLTIPELCGRNPQSTFVAERCEARGCAYKEHKHSRCANVETLRGFYEYGQCCCDGAAGYSPVDEPEDLAGERAAWEATATDASEGDSSSPASDSSLDERDVATATDASEGDPSSTASDSSLDEEMLEPASAFDAKNFLAGSGAGLGAAFIVLAVAAAAMVVRRRRRPAEGRAGAVPDGDNAIGFRSDPIFSSSSQAARSSVEMPTMPDKLGQPVVGGQADGELEAGLWRAAVDPDSGSTFYYNSATNETSWNRPPGWNAP